MDRLLSKVRHALGVFRVYRRPLVRFLDYFHLIRVGTRLRVTLRNGLTVTVRAGTSDFGVIDDIFISGVYDKALNRLREGQKVIDIGAQCGIFALAAAARGATVLCVEPLPENYELLVGNARLNGYETRIACQNVAVAGTRGPMKLHVAEGNTGGSTFYPSMHPQWMRNPRLTTIEVQCVTLRDVLDYLGAPVCDCLKMDCEGAEFDVLPCAEAEDLRRVHTVILEYHPRGDVHSIRMPLEGLGFTVEICQRLSILYASTVEPARTTTVEPSALE